MSIIDRNAYCYVINHRTWLNELVSEVYFREKCYKYECKREYFDINQPFKADKKRCNITRKNNTFFTDCCVVLKLYNSQRDFIVNALKDNNQQEHVKNLKTLVDQFLRETAHRKIGPLSGGNNSDKCVVGELKGERYLIPANAKFYNYDVVDIGQHVGEKFDMVLLDPPWWNKYIRRKRTHNADEAYDMMTHENIGMIPIKDLLDINGIVVVWCTNAVSHTNALLEYIFPQWGLQHIATWYWLKVTTQGEPVTPFSSSGGKQPFERILFASRSPCRDLPLPEDGKLVVSVPSAVHSHKPPLCELLKPYIPPNPQCLEIFARTLTPHWTSYGNEVLKLQHISLFTQVYPYCDADVMG